MDTARAADIILENSNMGLVFSSLKREGIQYPRSISTAPWTLPSHASLFTGTFPSKHGAHAGHKRLDGSLVTLAELFGDAGYETVAVSNNTWISEEFGFARGFETFYKTWQYVQSATDLGEIARTEEGLDKLRAVVARLADGNPVVNLTNAFYGRFLRKQSDDGAARTNEWIADWLESRDPSRPFFLFVNYLEPHLEYRPSQVYAEPYLPDGVTYDEAMAVPQDAWGYIAGTVPMSDHEFDVLRGLYRGEIAYLADRIADLKQFLVDAGEWDDTIFVVTSDHGENIGDHGLMDHQYSLYDTLLHVPLFIAGPSFEAGETDDRLVQLVDLPPTLLDAAGIDAPEVRAQFQGRSFHPDSDEPPREFAFAEYLAPQPSMDALERRVGSLADDVRRYDRSLRAIRTARYKFIRGSDGSTELYDVREDPAETDDQSTSQPDVVADLEGRLDEWLDSFEHADPTDDVSMPPGTKDRLEDLGYLQ